MKMELTVRIACFCLLLVSSEQMSFYRKVASGMDRESEDQTWQGYRISESQEAASQPQMVSQKSGDSKRQLHEPGTLRDNIGWEISDHSVLDAELYGADNENMDDVNFDIVLGQRIDLQDSSVGKREKLKGHDVQKRSSKTSPNFHSVKERVKRNAIDKSKDEGKTLSQQTSSVHTTGTHQIKDTNRMDKISRGSQAGILSNASSEESNEIESSGDGEIFPEASKEPKNINSSSASDQNLFRNHTVFDTEDTFSTLTDKEGEAVGVKVVSCDDKNPSSSCLEQSGIGQNSDQDRNQVLSEDGSALDGNVKLNQKNDSSGTEHNVSTTNIGLEDNTSASPSVTSTQQNPDVEVSSQHPAAAVETSAKETTTSVDNQATTNNRGTPEEENQTSYTTITINPVDSDQTTTITTTISDTTKTSMPETTIAQSDSTAATETTKLDATNTPNLFTISDSTATTEKILTDPTIASETTISNSPSAVENTFSDSTTTPEAETSTTAAPKRVPKLGESCDPPSPAVDAGSECVDIPGVGCVNRTCQCKPQWYKAGDACYERELDEGFLLKLDNDQVGSLTVTWPPIKPSANYDLIEYKLRWISVTSTSGDDINTLVSSTKTIEKASSSSKTQIFRSHNLVREKKVLDTGSDTDTDTDANTDTGPVRKKRSSGAKEMVLYTNETTARIQDLTPGEKYEFEVSAMVRMKEDGREEELKYPTGTLRLEPDCLSLETKRLIAGNRTMILTFQDLQGVFNECRVQIGNKKPRLDDCKTFQLHPFEFGTKYKIITEVVAGEQEPKSCRDMSFVYEESKKPGKVSSLSETGVTSDTISVSWDPPSQANGYLTGYDVYLQSEDTCKLYEIRDRSMKGQDEPQEQDKNVGSVHKTNEQSAPVRKECETHDSEILRSAEEQQNLTFTDLELSTEYHVRVFAINKEGMGEESETTINTKSLVPGPPENFTGVATSQSSIALTWIPPEPYPGPTDYYIKVFMRANWEIDTDLTKNPIYNDTVTGYETRRKTIHDLRLATAYDFKIEAKTSAGKSIEVTTGPVQTWEKRSPAVDGLEDSTVTFDTVALVWRQPPQGNGRTRAYVILVKDTGDTCLQAFALVNSKSNLGPFQPSVSSLDKLLSMTCPSGQILKETVPDDKRLATSATIKALKPNTLYTFEVIPYNGAGLGDSSSLQRRTKNAIPNEPTAFTCATHEPGELRLSWTPPVPMPGITTYELRVLAQNGLPHMVDQHLNDFKTLTIKGYSEETYILKGLNPYWKFKVYMKASTPAGKSTEVSTDICTTLPAAPGKIIDLSTKVDYNESTEIILQWKCPLPDDRHGKLELFKVVALPKSTTRADIVLQSLPRFENAVTVQANEDGVPDCDKPFSLKIQIAPQVTYTIEVSAKVKDVDTFGASFTTSFYAPGKAPPALPVPMGIVASDKDHEQEAFAFWTSLCPTCLANNANGEVKFFGLGVCKKGFCNANSRQNGSFADYKALVTWKTSKAADFQLPYQISDNKWKDMVLAKAQANEATMKFAVGSDTGCAKATKSVSCNGPLPAESEFRVFQFSCTEDGCAESALSDSSVTAAPVSTSSSDPIVIGGALSGVAVAIIVILVIVIMRIKFRKVINITQNEPVQMMQMSDITCPENAIPDKSRPIKIKEFEEVLQQLHAENNDLFAQEFKELDMDSPVHPTEVGLDPQHRRLNRWSNIVPYDHTRVKLKVVDGDEKCADDYINANYIVGYASDRDYIATQGPLTSTVPDFWRMVWEQNVSVIVMLSAFKELDPRSQSLREKVAEYFPDESDVEGSEGRCYDHVAVSWRGKLDNQAWEVRTFRLTHLLERRSRYVKHFFFKSWTDHKADISPQDLISFTNTVRREAESQPLGPIVVHCSAGVGRTGTFIAVDYFCRYIKKLAKGSRSYKVTDVMGTLKGSLSGRKRRMSEDSTIDIYGRIIALRDCRRYMVQTKAQYAFIYDVVMELIRQALRTEDTSDSGGDTESFISESVTGATGSCEAVYDDVDSLKRSGSVR